MGGKRGTRAEVVAKWRERLSRWQRLQCSVSEFCRREGVSQPSFFQWRKRLAAEKTELGSSVGRRGAAFIPVQVVAADDARSGSRTAGAAGRAQDAGLEISLGELVCRLSTEVDEATLRRLVRVLREEGAEC